jgi:hypothetical protein
MSTLIRRLRSAIVVAAGSAVVFAWMGSSGCKGIGDPSEPSTCTDPKLAPQPPPAKTCDSSKDVYTECPLPASQKVRDGSYDTVYYFSDPLCVSGLCTYCMTETKMEDPCATGLCH